MSFRSKALLLGTCAAIFLQIASAAAQNQRNLILFVPDGLRPLSVTPETAPTFAAVRDKGVNFVNPHSLFPTFTMANASGMATGHFLGDTGAFSNTIYTAYPVPTAGGSMTPFIENDPILGDIDAHFSGNFVDEDSLLFAARNQGFSTAAIGKLGPTLMFDHTERTGEATITVDDSTGSKQGIPLSQAVQDALKAAGLPLVAPSRKDTPGDNANAGDFAKAGTLVANVVQQKYFADVAAKVVLPMFKARNKPFVLAFWSRDPDGTQHNQGDSHLKVSPGINGPTSLASIKNADDNLADLRRALDELGLTATTDIVIAADHGFSTISKESKTSPAAQATYADVPAGLLPPGFVAIDIAKALDLPLYDPDDKNKAVEATKHSVRGNGLIGTDPEKPDVVVASNGGSDLVYVPNKDAALTRKVVAALLAQDYVSGLFVDSDLGSFPGTLPLSAINMQGMARTPRPAIVINFRSYTTDCGQPVMCSVNVADTTLQQGQGMHGSFSRADTMNFMAAIGPSFKTGFVDETPASNADVGKTIAHILGLKIPFKGSLQGRVVSEALPGGANPTVQRWVERSEPSETGLATILAGQRVGQTRYFDAAGFSGRTVGMDERKAASR
ncbi:MAG TPA: alkaline phosphatase family protein [Pseudolabrys sp.]|nr:alkaline phosphatase family protein [Pseudolabrys sp.]